MAGSHEPAPGHRQFRRLPAQHPEIFLAGRNVQALLGLEELLPGPLLPYPHPPRRILRIALHVAESEARMNERAIRASRRLKYPVPTTSAQPVKVLI